MKRTVILLALLVVMLGAAIAYACGGTKCITLPDGSSHCMYCNCEGQCF